MTKELEQALQMVANGCAAAKLTVAEHNTLANAVALLGAECEKKSEAKEKPFVGLFPEDVRVGTKHTIITGVDVPVEFIKEVDGWVAKCKKRPNAK